MPGLHKIGFSAKLPSSQEPSRAYVHESSHTPVVFTPVPLGCAVGEAGGEETLVALEASLSAEGEGPAIDAKSLLVSSAIDEEGTDSASGPVADALVLTALASMLSSDGPLAAPSAPVAIKRAADMTGSPPPPRRNPRTCRMKLAVSAALVVPRRRRVATAKNLTSRNPIATRSWLRRRKPYVFMSAKGISSRPSPLSFFLPYLGWV